MRCGGLLVVGWTLLSALPCCMAGDAVPPHLGWVEDPRTSVTVSWQREAHGRGTVEDGLTTNYTHAVSDAGGHRRRTSSRSATSHRARSITTDFLTDGFRFRPHLLTAPSATDSLHFVVHGDFRAGSTRTGRGRCHEIVAGRRSWSSDGRSFGRAVHVGQVGTWLQLFVVTDEWGAWSSMPTIGNHDEPADGNAFIGDLHAAGAPARATTRTTRATFISSC